MRPREKTLSTATEVASEKSKTRSAIVSKGIEHTRDHEVITRHSKKPRIGVAVFVPPLERILHLSHSGRAEISIQLVPKAAARRIIICIRQHIIV